MQSKVYGSICDELEVSSTAGKYRTYSVRLGDVCWNKNREYAPCVYVLVKCNGVLQYDVPPHYALEPDENGKSDFERVLEAMAKLKMKHGLI